jgi:hypothetical protein
MPFGRWFDKVLSRGQQPIIVKWVRPDEGISIDQRTGAVKQVRCEDEDILLTICAPCFAENKTDISFGVTNMSSKALGFGARGIGLVFTSRGQKSTLTATSLSKGLTFEPNQTGLQNILVDAGESATSITAIFDAAQKVDRAEAVIQANRILAAPYLFVIPFETGEFRPTERERLSPR